MDDFLQITCPDCKTVLIVERRSGKIVEVRRPILEESTGDRFEDAIKKVRERPSAAEKKFRKALENEKSKKAKLDQLFKEKLKQVEESGKEVRPPNPFDFD
jgi:uncharacterized Zn finger protein (UPF0148 family)